jgi:hypothetical protein
MKPLQQKPRSAMDKIVDFLLNDGPNNKYALICQNCFSHNGLVSEWERDRAKFRCAICGFFNGNPNANTNAPPPMQAAMPFLPNPSSSTPNSTLASPQGLPPQSLLPVNLSQSSSSSALTPNLSNKPLGTSPSHSPSNSITSPNLSANPSRSPSSSPLPSLDSNDLTDVTENQEESEESSSKISMRQRRSRSKLR